jgi:broad specificity phosphatase PhoE
VAQRLAVIAHGPTAWLGNLVFGDSGPLVDARAISPVTARVAWWRHGPEAACAETAARLGGPGDAMPRLGSCDFGSWTGRSLADVGAEDPEAIRNWLADPHAKPHGGESLSELITRVGAAIDQTDWPDGQSMVVVSPLVASAIAVYALKGPPEMILRIDVSPLGRVRLSRSTGSWRLRLDPGADL